MATSFAPLFAPTVDDTMDITSPAAHNQHDDDIIFDDELIDTDYNDGVALQQPHDDEQMMTDAEHVRPSTATDDMMDDDATVVQREFTEAEMVDTPDLEEEVRQDDDELIDYGDDEYDQPPEVTYQGEVHIADDVQLPNHTDDGGMVQQQLPDDSIVDEEIARASNDADIERSETFHSEHLDESTVEAPVEDAAQLVQDEHVDQSLTIDTTLSASFTEQGPSTPTDTGLHPITLRYGDHVLPLFKSKRQQDGLLKNDNLASLSLAELMKACRSRLAIHFGQAVSETQDVVFRFDNLGLTLAEDSRSAFEVSLKDVLDVYTQLHHNDSSEEAPALAVTLELRFRFASTLEMLKVRAQSGEGMASFGEFAQEILIGDEYVDGVEGEEAEVVEEHSRDATAGLTDGLAAETAAEQVDQDPIAAGQTPALLDDNPGAFEEEVWDVAEQVEATSSVNSTRGDALDGDDGAEELIDYGDDEDESAAVAEHTAQIDEAHLAINDESKLEQRSVREADGEAAEHDAEQEDVVAAPADDGEYEDALADEDDEGNVEASDADADDGQDHVEHLAADAHTIEANDEEDTTADNDDAQPDGAEGQTGEVEDAHEDQDPLEDEDYFDEEHDDDPEAAERSLHDSHTNGEAKADDVASAAPDQTHVHATAPALSPADDVENLFDPEDDIGFDDESTLEHEARRASESHVVAVSPLGSKRTHADAGDEIDFEDDEPESKKVRAV